VFLPVYWRNLFWVNILVGVLSLDGNISETSFLTPLFYLIVLIVIW